jgi:hypothetical protein
VLPDRPEEHDVVGANRDMRAASDRIASRKHLVDHAQSVTACHADVVGGVAWAAIPSDDGTIYACYGNGDARCASTKIRPLYGPSRSRYYPETAPDGG